MSDSFAHGMAVGAIGLDLYCHGKAWPTVGDQLRVWSTDNPWWALVIIAALFTLLGHFVLNGIHVPAIG